jgi:hypothetical protein
MFLLRYKPALTSMIKLYCEELVPHIYIVILVPHLNTTQVVEHRTQAETNNQATDEAYTPYISVYLYINPAVCMRHTGVSSC